MSNDKNRPVTLLEVPSSTEAAMAVSVLEAHDIEATTAGDFTAGFIAEAPGRVRVLVKQSDLARAQLTLSDVLQSNQEGVQEDEETNPARAVTCSVCSLSKLLWMLLGALCLAWLINVWRTL